MLYVDVHAHLHRPEFENSVEEMVSNAKDAGVCVIINTGYDIGWNAGYDDSFTKKTVQPKKKK